MTCKRILGIVCLLLGGTLICAAVAIAFIWEKSAEDAGVRSDMLLRQVQQVMRAELAEIDGQTAQNEIPMDSKSIALSVDGHACIGILHFPTLELTLPVLSSCSEKLLETAPCRQYGAIENEDLVIAGHNYRRHFKRLKELSLGDPVIFTDLQNKRYDYTVSLFETLLPTDLDRMLAGDWALSLYTCTAGGEKRFVVRCEKEAGN